MKVNVEKIYFFQELMSVIQKDNVFFYGAGNVSRCMLEHLDLEGVCLPKRMVVSSKSREDFLGINIIEADEMKEELAQAEIIICTYEKLHEEIAELLQQYDVAKIYGISNELCNRLIFKYSNKLTGIENKITDLNERISLIENRIIKSNPQPGLQYFILNITDHCNLKCAGCNHFSSIAEEKYYKLEEIEKDLIQMHTVFGDIPRIGIMGGEPLLHPDISSILETTRRIFPNSELLLSTNGILCGNLNDEFYETCEKNKITIRFTIYPINLDYEKLANEIKAKGIQVEYFLEEKECQEFTSIGLDIDGKQNPVKSFGECCYANQCVMLKEGNLYTCQVIPNIEHYNKAFGTNLKVSRDDYISIYNNCREDILKFLASPISFCRYCDTQKRQKRHLVWGISNRDCMEWR